MKLPGNRRTLILGGALALTLVAVVLVSDMDAPPVVVSVAAKRDVPVAAASNENGAALGAARVEAARKQIAAKPAANVFAARSFYVAQPKPLAAPPPPPPPPMAPPLPFKYMGRFAEDSTNLVIFLTVGDRLYTVRVGDVIDETYRVEKLTPTELIFIYLPMDERQTLPIAEAS